VWLRIGAAAIASLLLWLGVDAWVGGTSHVTVEFAGRDVDLLSPHWLKLVTLAPVFFLLRALSLTDLSLLQQLLQSALRSLAVAGIALALARPVWTSYQSRVATVVLVDVSDSISGDQLSQAQAYVADLARSKGDDSLQVVTFAESPRTVEASTDGFVLARHAGAGAGTDVQAALQLAYGLFPTGTMPKVVVVSDGNQTEGDVVVEAYRARELGVKVAWRSFSGSVSAELRVVGLSLPDDIKVGQPFELTAEIWSTHTDEVQLTLQQDEFPNPLEPVKTVALREGKNFVKFKSEAKRAGFTTYRLKLARFGRDTEPANNQAVLTSPVTGRPRVLYVEGGARHDPRASGYFKQALEHENIDVEVRGPQGIPSDPRKLESYDLVVMSDVPAVLLGAGQMQALDTYVQGLGGGFLIAGGEDSFGSGGYQGTRIEQIMPVRFDSERTREQPDIALVLVIDRSGSMQGQKIEAAKESARVTAQVLAPSDMVAVVAFDNDAAIYVRPQRAANRMRIDAELSRLQPGGGTNIYPGLREAFSVLQGIDAKVKHVILLSDGEAPTDGLVELVSDMRAARITISAVGVQGAERGILAMITDAGDGRLYMVEDIGSMPRIFMKETTEVQKAQLVEDLVHVRVAKQVEAIEGTGVENAPPLHGYVTTKPKPTSEVILISDLGEPILARWRHGAGTAVAWTSDIKNRWSSEWIRWGGYPKFWAQVVRTSMRRKTYDSYDLTAQVLDGRARVTVDALDSSDRFVNNLDTQLEVIDPATGHTVQSLPMQQTAAGRYGAEFRVERYGAFLLKAVHRRDGRIVAESTGAVSLSYPLEYLRSTASTAALAQAATITGGYHNATPEEMWAADGQPIATIEDLWPWVLLLVAGVFILDLYARRVRLFGYRTIAFR
jgi:Mg-chelatase subunit ChlD